MSEFAKIAWESRIRETGMKQESEIIIKQFHTDVIQLTNAEENGIRVFICEDKPEHAEQLEKILKKLQGEIRLTVVSYTSARNLLLEMMNPEHGPALPPDVVFLDVEMPDMDGITLGKKVRELVPECFLIFTTAYAEYAIKGYEAQAFRYLLKPMSEEMIRQVMRHIQEHLRQKKKLLIKSSDREQILSLQDVIYLSAEDKYTILYTKEGHFIDRRALSEYEEQLQMYGFYRIHRKYIVNAYYHKAIQKGRVALSTGTELPISRRRAGNYHRAILQNLEKELLK